MYVGLPLRGLFPNRLKPSAWKIHQFGSSANFQCSRYPLATAVNYLPAFKGIDTLVVKGNFANGYVTADTRIIAFPLLLFSCKSGQLQKQEVVFTDTSEIVNGIIAQRKLYFGDGTSDTTSNLQKLFEEAEPDYDENCIIRREISPQNNQGLL
ncbi:MAG: hypothetical protein K2X86_04370 [Cytophagaceae bacterium]|nr:hypothetical protein [Cytophagaceae bacterium]